MSQSPEIIPRPSFGKAKGFHDLLVGHLVDALKRFFWKSARRAFKQLPSPRAKVGRVLFGFIVAHLALISPAAALDMRDYWPSLGSNQQLVSQDLASQNGSIWMGLSHRYVNRGLVRDFPVMRLEDWLSTGLVDAWELRNDGTQMLEVADWFGSQHKVYEVGKEFTWGGVVNVGDVIVRTIHVDVAASIGETVGPQNWATQELRIEAAYPTFTNPAGVTFTDVVQVKMFQSFCITWACGWPSGQSTYVTRHWFARGLGIIQTEYLMINSVSVSPQRIDYVISCPLLMWVTP